MIKIVLADDHPMARMALKQLIETDENCRIIAEAVNGEEAIHCVQQHQPDLLILDINMPKKNGIEAAQTIKNFFPQLKMLVITAQSDFRNIKTLTDIGVNGYVLKDAELETIHHAIHNILGGGRFFQEQVMKKMLSKDNAEKILTSREQQILQWTVNGFSANDIAIEIKLNKRTVEDLRTKVYEKLNAKNKLELIKIATDLGFVTQAYD